MLVSAQEIANRLNAMKDDDVLAVIKHGDDFEIIDLDQDPQGKHATIDLDQDPREPEADHVHNRHGANFGCTICWDQQHATQDAQNGEE
jgi:formate dehydrogenase assembly factor FdhD